MSTAMQNISLYIPHVFSNISSKKICDVFDFQGIGDIQKVVLISKKDRNGRTYNAAYIHFKEWYDNIASRNFQERVLDKSKEARIVYDEPWYWIVLENKGRKFKPDNRKPVIDLKAFGYEQAIKPANEEVVKSYDANYQYYCNYEEFSRSETLNKKTIEEYVDDMYEEFSLSDRHFESDEE